LDEQIQKISNKQGLKLKVAVISRLFSIPIPTKLYLIYNINLFHHRKIWGWSRTRNPAGWTVGRADRREECSVCSSTRQWNSRCPCKLVCSEKKKIMECLALSTWMLHATR